MSLDYVCCLECLLVMFAVRVYLGYVCCLEFIFIMFAVFSVSWVCLLFKVSLDYVCCLECLLVMLAV